MQTKTLSAPALNIINNYLHLPFPGKGVSCPYFNNRNLKVRAALRVNVGKGSPDDIAQEASLIALREKIDLKELNNEQLKQFFVENNLGVDCSGLVYYVLSAELEAKNKGKLSKHLFFPHAKNPLRKLLVKLRAVENVNVEVLAHDKNSRVVSLAETQPGDMIVMLNVVAHAGRDHMLIIHQIDYEEKVPKTIHYTHSLQWSADGKYNHGVRQGTIEITDINKPLNEQRWIEIGKEGKENETFARAKKAEKFLIKRLN